jgi:hypothetical protein
VLGVQPARKLGEWIAALIETFFPHRLAIKSG